MVKVKNDLFIKRVAGWLILTVCSMPLAIGATQAWRSHMAYNNVTRIAMAPNEVYALSDGSIFSVNKLSEQISLYDRQSGLNGTDITCIEYDQKGEQLVIGYATGKIDILTATGTRYISALYEKDMTQRKNIYNVTISGRTAYLSTHFGIQTFDLRELKLVDSYWLRPDGQETPVLDVTLTKDSIYAFTSDSMFVARLTDNIVDYRYWKREARSSRMQPDPEKGKHYQDEASHWYAGGAEGIIRQTITERLTYKPKSPISNISYRLNCGQGRLYMLQGGRWANEYKRPGMVMIYDGEEWINIPTEKLTAKLGTNNVRDFMNVAVDPNDKNHFFVTSYGTGLYEFAGDTLLRRYLPGPDNPIESASKSNPELYTRTDFATYDMQGNLWFLNAGNVTYPIICLDAQGEWHGLPVVVDGEKKPLATPGGFILDSKRANYKWFAIARYRTALFLLDDGGTPFDESDDRITSRNEWLMPDGHTIAVQFIYALMQTVDGCIWLGTDQGVVIIDPKTDFFQSNRGKRPQVMDDNGENPLAELEISAICQDKKGYIWVGTNTLGVYVLNDVATSIVAHYTTDNSSMPSNSILSLATNEEGSVFVGTANGLVEHLPNADPVGSLRPEDEENLDQGSFMQWKLHMSYTNLETMMATPERIYALSNGSLCYVDRADDHIGYMNKTTGLNGSSVTCIGYDKSSENLVIGYIDGQIDLVDKDNNVRQLPDLHMKAGSVSATINAISSGAHCSYLSMPFGILVVNAKKGEISDTYYIGDQASDVNVQNVIELGDSIFAFTSDSLYAASLSDNLVDFSFWHATRLPKGEVTHHVLFKNQLHILVDNTLYCYNKGVWTKVMTTKVQWLHVSDGQLLTYVDSKGLYRITDEYQLTGLSNKHTPRDAVYTRGEYWLVEVNKGVVRLQSDGDAIFVPEGPNSNIGYFMHTAHNKVYTTVGGRWAAQYFREPYISIYTGAEWQNIGPREMEVYEAPQWISALDPVSITVDPNDPEHFYIATYCAGVFEYNHGTTTRYGDGVNGSTLKVVNADPSIAARKHLYTRTDGAMMDEQGNLWVLNATSIGQPVHVMTPNHTWHGLSQRFGGAEVILRCPAALRMDRRDSRFKWFLDQRVAQGVYLLNDGGTPTKSSDDHIVKRSSFVDQNGQTVSPSFFYSLEQDRSNRMWIGTENGIIIIPEDIDLFTSNDCYRIIIPRNDGTGLGDYLLANEQINCMAVDGGNRMWIGTAGSGLYLIEDDTITVAHFTENNSNIPSNTILSIAIVPETGEVFVGTDHGIASYLSDASEPREDMSDAYAYPNPVRPDYGGSVSITGLMDNSEVNIIDESGNLVCKTRSNGGTAVWDCRLKDGRRATAGVYTALCNTKGGHKAVKILVIR